MENQQICRFFTAEAFIGAGAHKNTAGRLARAFQTCSPFGGLSEEIKPGTPINRFVRLLSKVPVGQLFQGRKGGDLSQDGFGPKMEEYIRRVLEKHELL